MTEALASKTCTPCRGGYLRSRASKLSSFMDRPQIGNCWRRLTASSGAFGLEISGRYLGLARNQVSQNCQGARRILWRGFTRGNHLT